MIVHAYLLRILHTIFATKGWDGIGAEPADKINVFKAKNYSGTSIKSFLKT
jgi:hypothetical protein